MQASITATRPHAFRLLGLAMVCLWFAAQSAALWHSHDVTPAHERCAQCAAAHVDDLIVHSALQPAAAALPGEHAAGPLLPGRPIPLAVHYGARAPPHLPLI